jgi:hypothetical protein
MASAHSTASRSPFAPQSTPIDPEIIRALTHVNRATSALEGAAREFMHDSLKAIIKGEKSVVDVQREAISLIVELLADSDEAFEMLREARARRAVRQ